MLATQLQASDEFNEDPFLGGKEKGEPLRGYQRYMPFAGRNKEDDEAPTTKKSDADFETEPLFVKRAREGLLRLEQEPDSVHLVQLKV